MSFKQWILNQLTDRGMFDDQAATVFEAFKNDNQNEAMLLRWNDLVDDYPVSMRAVLLLGIKTFALKWIDENCPQAWFRSMFVD